MCVLAKQVSLKTSLNVQSKKTFSQTLPKHSISFGDPRTDIIPTPPSYEHLFLLQTLYALRIQRLKYLFTKTLLSVCNTNAMYVIRALQGMPICMISFTIWFAKRV